MRPLTIAPGGPELNTTRRRTALVAAGALTIVGAVLLATRPTDATAPVTLARDGATTASKQTSPTRDRSVATATRPTVTPSTVATTRPSATPSARASTGSSPGSSSATTAARSRAAAKAAANVGPVAVDPSTLFPTGPLRSTVSGWPVDAGSAAYVSRLGGLDLVVSLRQWTVPVYGAGAGTLRSDVALTHTWGTGLSSLDDVPIPARAAPDPAGDGHLTVVQPSSGCVYDLFRARGSGGSWSASSGNAIGRGSSGIYPGGGGTRAAGFSAALGLVWPQEIERGRIDHALVFAYPYTRSGAPVAPATRSDGRTTTAGALPMGARLRLDPALDLSTLGLNRAERVIARALQEYGMVLGDTSGGFTLYAAHPRGLGHDPYAKLFGTTSDWASLAKIPKDRFQVLRLPGPAPEGRDGSSCAQLR